MAATFILSVLLVGAQAAALAPAADPAVEVREVAYEQLADGRAAQAIAALEASLRQNPDDPATLINLGTAYARSGDSERAALAFRAASTSDIRYRLELADGSWVDSRQAARRALAGLEQSRPLAALGD